MTRSAPRSLHWWISAALVTLATIAALALTLQGYRSQGLVEHPIWRQLLEASASAAHSKHASDSAAAHADAGVLQSWRVSGDAVPHGVPDYLLDLPPGYHSTEGRDAVDGSGARFHALVTAVDGGRLITAIDIGDFEDQQNRDARANGAWGAVLIALVAGLITWLHWNLVRPVADIARRLRAIDPGLRGQRLPLDYRQEELRVIAQASNVHLDRVEEFMARERSLLEQASHEFRTPVAVISGALDLLNRMPLPDVAQPALRRIGGSVEILSETMVALLYLAREPSGTQWQDVTVLDQLLPALVSDHAHLAADRKVDLSLGALQPTHLSAPESMLRIAIGNLLRNAIEHSSGGRVEISLAAGEVRIADSGQDFDPAEAARRYRQGLREAVPAWGQGLGMFMVGRICDRFGWRLQFDTRTGQGTTARLDVSDSAIDAAE